MFSGIRILIFEDNSENSPVTPHCAKTFAVPHNLAITCVQFCFINVCSCLLGQVYNI